MLQNLLLLCFALAVPVAIINACSCMEWHPQQAFCQADFVIKARVKGNRVLHRRMTELDPTTGTNRTVVEPLKRVHFSKTLRTFKASPEFMNLTRHHLYSSIQSSMCGVTLRDNTKYLIAGFMYDGKPHVSLCDMIMPWDDVSVRQKKGLSFLYERACSECEVSTCYYRGCRKSRAQNKCLWEQPGRSYTVGSPRYDICYKKHSACTQRNGHCRWTTSAELKTCFKETMMP